jgi:hypothetical protein
VKVEVAGRQAGKTHRAVAWVKAGNKIDRYPGWDRVLLTHSITEVVRIRARYNLDPHQVYSIREWIDRNKMAFADVEVMVDNLDIWIEGVLGPVVAATMTGEPWEHAASDAVELAEES